MAAADCAASAKQTPCVLQVPAAARIVAAGIVEVTVVEACVVSVRLAHSVMTQPGSATHVQRTAAANNVGWMVAEAVAVNALRRQPA